MHKQTKLKAIPKSVKLTVWERDNEHCVFCGRWVDEYCACAHFIARSQGGLGIEENILTLCAWCHQRYDNSPYRQEMRTLFAEHLKKHYPDWDEQKLIYKKGL